MRDACGEKGKRREEGGGGVIKEGRSSGYGIVQRKGTSVN